MEELVRTSKEVPKMLSLTKDMVPGSTMSGDEEERRKEGESRGSGWKEDREWNGDEAGTGLLLLRSGLGHEWRERVFTSTAAQLYYYIIAYGGEGRR